MELVVLCDPQTSGGLLISVDPTFQKEFERIAVENNANVFQIGELVKGGKKAVFVA